jgi:hypothetical protein
MPPKDSRNRLLNTQLWLNSELVYATAQSRESVEAELAQVNTALAELEAQIAAMPEGEITQILQSNFYYTSKLL